MANVLMEGHPILPWVDSVGSDSETEEIPLNWDVVEHNPVRTFGKQRETSQCPASPDYQKVTPLAIPLIQ